MADDKAKDLTVPELKEKLENAGQPTDGKKEELVERYEDVQSGDVHVPQTFFQRFDPSNPPEEDPGPVLSY